MVQHLRIILADVKRTGLNFYQDKNYNYNSLINQASFDSFHLS